MLAALLLLLCPAADAPQAHEVLRFAGTAQYATESWRFAVAHVEYLERVGMWGTAWHAEAVFCRRAHDLMDDLKRVHPNDEALCRKKLALLRDLLGDDDFYAGRLPPPAPTWRFSER